MFKTLGEGYKNHIERYSNIRRYAAVYSLTWGLAATVLLPLGDAHGANKSAIQGKPKTNEIATAVSDGNVSGSVIIWRYDGKGGYEPVFKQEGISGFPGIAIGDADNDGINDVAVTSKGGSYVINYKDGDFVSRKLGEYERKACTVAVGDADNDGRNEVLIFERDGKRGVEPATATIHFYRCDENEEYQHSEWPGLVGSIRGAKIVDVDGDGRNEILSLAAAAGVAVTEYRNGKFQIDHVLSRKKSLERLPDRYAQAGYDGEILPLLDTSIMQDMDIGDITGDGSKCLLLSDFTGQIQVVKLTGKGCENLFLDRLFDNSRRYLEKPRSCAVGDVDNDGGNEMIFGSKRLWVCGYNGGKFEKLWESEKFVGEKSTQNVADICVADSDDDGMNEIIYSEPAGFDLAKRQGKISPEMHRLVVLENRSRGKMEFDRAWQSDVYTGFFAIAVGDIDGK